MMGRNSYVQDLPGEKVLDRTDGSSHILHSFPSQRTERIYDLVQMIPPGGFGVTWLRDTLVGSLQFGQGIPQGARERLRNDFPGARGAGYVMAVWHSCYSLLSCRS